jgi:uncharacterized protein YfaS (alpha-2-macroglobulin family)
MKQTSKARTSGSGMLSKVFGTLSWKPPSWLGFLKGFRANLKELSSRLFGSIRQTAPKTKKVVKWGAISLGTLIIVLGLLMWYAAWHAGALTVTGTAPGLTKIEDVLKPDPVDITFSGSAARLDLIGKVVTTGITLSPPIEGEWQWLEDDHLVFTPKVDWAVGQEYTVKMDRSLFPKHVRLATYSYSFQTPPFEATIENAEFYQDPEDPKIKKVLVTVRFTHPVDAKSFEKRVQLRRSDQKKGLMGIGAESYPFTVSYDTYRGEAYIHSKPMEVPEKDMSMTVTVDAGVRAERGGPETDAKLERTVTIPGKYNFLRVVSAEVTLVRNERYEPEQVLVIQTSGGVQEEEIVNNLTAYILPRDRPAFQGQLEEKNYHWSDPAFIGPEVLDRSEPLQLTPLPADREYAVMHSFKFTAAPGRYLYIKLNKGIEGFGGYLLAKEYDVISRVPAFPRELGIMLSGSILSLSGEKKLSVYVRGIEAIRFEVGRVLPDQINHLVSQTQGDFTNPDFTNYQFNQDNITERFTEVRRLQAVAPEKAQYTSFDFSRYLTAGAASNRGLFFFKVEGWDPKKKRPMGVSDERLILVTDLGVLVKDNADASHDVFVQSIHTGRPVGGALVEVLGKNGLPALSVFTDQDGHATLPNLKDFKREKAPTVYLIRKGNDLSFLPFDRYDRRLNLSRFDVGGEVTGGEVGRLNAYLFSDRGIYRPGDVFHVGMIVKATDWKQHLAGIPLEAAVTDARGLEVKKQKITLSASGFEEVQYRTEETAPTGAYTTSLYIVKDNRRGALLGSVAVRVEEFLPDRLKITTHLSTERAEGWVSPAGLKGRVMLQNLYGTPAVKHRIGAEITLSPAFPAFRQYKDYTFFDPLRTDKSFSDRLEDAVTDEQGEAEFGFNLDRFDKATYRLIFSAEGFELEGGRSVASESSVLVSPLPYLIGYKPDGDLTFISKESSRSVQLIAVDPGLAKIGVSDLTAQIIEERYVSALTKQSSGVYKYQSIKKEIPVSKEPLAIPDKGLRFSLPTQNPGDFLLIIRDTNNVELSRIAFSVAGAANLTRALERNAELQVKLNKTDFVPGEEIQLSIRAPYTGAGLITIERDRVYAYRWFKTESTSSVQQIRIPANFEGNGYVNVSFVRAIDSPEIFMSPLSYGVMPFSVSREKRTIAIDLDTPDLARPGEPFRIRYKGNRSGKAIVFAVDEGILQVARYQTPDPLGHFFRKRALEVRTAQILDLILPEAALLKQLSAIGGGGYAREALGKNLNPFKRRREKPVVYWSGIVDIGTEARELTYRVPDYFNGTLRVMAVAVSSDAVGANQKKTPVRGHFVLSPNVPTFVAPGDTFTVTVGVANNIEGSSANASVALELAASKHLEVVDNTTREIVIPEGREASAAFTLRAKQMLGAATLTFTASLGDKKSSYAIEASIRPIVPYETTVTAGSFTSGAREVKITREMYPELRILEASASPLPLGIAHGLTAYLRTFPYLCTEQLVSRTFPAIVLKNRPEFGYLHKDAEANLAQTISVLQARQNAEGAFGFWAANSHVSDYQSVYAMHFLTEARERGYAIPEGLIARGISYLRSLAQRPSDTLAEARAQAYAIYIMTRNGAVTTNDVTALHERLDSSKDLKGWKKDLIAAYLAATYKLLKLDAKAADLISGIKPDQVIEPDYAVFYDTLSHNAQFLYLVAKHFPERFEKLSGAYIQAIAGTIAQGAYSTISSAYAILAMEAYAEAVGIKTVADISIKEILDTGPRELALPQGLFPKTAFSPQAQKVRIESTSDYPTFYQVTQAGYDKALPDKELKDRLEVQREYRDLKGNVLTKTAIGSELEVHVKMRSVDSSTFYNVAIIDLLPGGFEVVLEKSRPPVPPAYPQEEEFEEGEEEEYENDLPPAGPRWTPPIGTARSTWSPDFVDIREDRVVLFGTVGPKAQEFVYRIKATNKGTFAVPPIYGECMYERTVRARALPGTITVEEKQ